MICCGAKLAWKTTRLPCKVIKFKLDLYIYYIDLGKPKSGAPDFITIINFLVFWVYFPELLSCLFFTKRGLPFVFARQKTLTTDYPKFCVGMPVVRTDFSQMGSLPHSLLTHVALLRARELRYDRRGSYPFVKTMKCCSFAWATPFDMAKLNGITAAMLCKNKLDLPVKRKTIT